MGFNKTTKSAAEVKILLYKDKEFVAIQTDESNEDCSSCFCNDKCECDKFENTNGLILQTCIGKHNGRHYIYVEKDGIVHQANKGKELLTNL